MCRWLIEREDRRLLREAQRNGGELSLTGTQGSYIAMLQMCCADAFNCRSGAFAILGGWTSWAATVVPLPFLDLPRKRS